MDGKHLTANERFYIERRLGEEKSLRQIASELGVAASTVSNEIRRNTLRDFDGIYCHSVAEKLAIERRAKAKAGSKFGKISGTAEQFIRERLRTHTSPDVISGELALKHQVSLSESTIYRYIKADRVNGGKLYKDLPHRGKPYNKKISSTDKVKIKNRVGIEERPIVANEKTEAGHWELDTIFGKDQKSFLLTLVDKATKTTIVRKLANKQADTIAAAFVQIAESTLYDFKTLTSDNGSEFAMHERISEITGAKFYFANPYHSWERGLNEHTNGLIRRFYPKGTDFNDVSDDDIAQLEHILNTRGRASLGYKAPNDLFLEKLRAA